jgi:hypothetical protein|tara:strand:+ start:997 stop:1401 length:405 start_codon:yes stop_codon:yes gene_type:complete
MASNEKWTQYGVGLHNVGSYQVAGLPYITGSATLPQAGEFKAVFPQVSRNITVINHGTGTLAVHFNPTGSGRVIGGLHYVELDSDEDSITFNVKAREIYVSNNYGHDGNFRIIAELTQIDNGRMFNITGAGLTE